MSEAHGVITGKVKITITGTGAGLTVYVKPLTLPLRRALSVQSERVYPYPDAKLYERSRKALGAMPSIDGSDIIPAEDNPAYREACEGIDKTRALWLVDAALDACVTCDAKDVLIKAYEADLAALQGLNVDTLRVLPWANVLYHFLCNADGAVSEWAILVMTVNGAMPLTEGETREGITFFRLDLQRFIAQRFTRQSGASGTPQAKQDTSIESDGRDDRSAELGDELRPVNASPVQLANPTPRDTGAENGASSFEYLKQAVE